jgi:hypothetical protein
LALGAAVLVVAQPAAAVLVAEPTVLGPSGSVHHEETGGFEGGYDWVDTQGIDNPEINAGLWEPFIPSGLYQVEAWQPLAAGYTYARYEITHSGKANEVRLRQSNFGAQWVTLGTYFFDGSAASVRSTDSAGLPKEQLAWSAMRWTPVATLPPNVVTESTTTTINEPLVSGPEEFVVRFVGIGYRGDLLRVHAQGEGASAVNTASWRVPLSAGEYTVEAFIPREHAEAQVSYTVQALDGNHSVALKQKSYNDLWVTLGDFTFGSAGATVTSTDATGVKEEEIAWDALRFVARPVSPPPGGVAGQTPGGGDKAGGTGTVKPGGGSPEGSNSKSIVPAQAKNLLTFGPLRIHTSVRGAHRADVYELISTRPVPGTLKLSYRCRMCLFVTLPLRLHAGSAVPYTHRSRRVGEIAALFGKPFYRGSNIEITVSATGMQPRHYDYRFPGSRKVKRNG